jgi:hypothetical protein
MPRTKPKVNPNRRLAASQNSLVNFEISRFSVSRRVAPLDRPSKKILEMASNE